MFVNLRTCFGFLVKRGFDLLGLVLGLGFGVERLIFLSQVLMDL